MTTVDSSCLSPLVLWAQDSRNVFLKVELRKAQDIDISVTDSNRLQFKAQGHGSRGHNSYFFGLELFSNLSSNSVKRKVAENGVELSLEKAKQSWWPRLTAARDKLPWLRFDFQKWTREEEYDTEPEPEDPQEELYNKMQAQEMVDKLLREQSPEFNWSNIFPKQTKQPYLLSFNLAMFLGYFLIVVELGFGWWKEGAAYLPRVWTELAPKLKCCQLGQFLEVLHGCVGLTRTNWRIALLQVGARFFILFIVLSGEPRLTDKPFVFYLFSAWSLIEIFRYPYYALAVKGQEWGCVTWLRYTMWIPLYPLGMLCEATIVFRAIPFYQQTQRFTFLLPNRLNFSFHFASFLIFLILFAFIPGIVLLMSYMRQQRVGHLKKRNGKKCD